jgi:hypothetical protein
MGVNLQKLVQAMAALPDAVALQAKLVSPKKPHFMQKRYGLLGFFG